MRIETEVKRIDRDSHTRLPRDVVKRLAVRTGDHILLDVQRAGGTVEDLIALRGKYQGLPKLDRLEMWGE